MVVIQIIKLLLLRKFSGILDGLEMGGKFYFAHCCQLGEFHYDCRGGGVSWPGQ